MSVSEIVQLITAVLAAIAATLGAWNRRRIEDVHRQGNANAERQVARVDQLARSLQAANVDVPARPEDIPDPTVPPEREGAG